VYTDVHVGTNNLKPTGTSLATEVEHKT